MGDLTPNNIALHNDVTRVLPQNWERSEYKADWHAPLDNREALVKVFL